MSTIKDIARAAGVSISTVSYALNGIPKVTPETRDRILAIARELNYHPNSLARNLKTGSTQRIGVFMHELSGSYINAILSGIQDIVADFDFDLIAAAVNSRNQSRAHSLLREKWLDGAILVNSANIDPGLLQTVSQSLPLVLLDRDPALGDLVSENIRALTIDNHSGACAMTRRLVEHGRRRFLFLAGHHDSYDNRQRYLGFRSVLDEAGIAFGDERCLVADFNNQLASTRVRDYLATHPCPDAIFCANDEMALGTMHALNEAGIKIPDDVAVSGFDDIEFAQYSHPPLSTVRYDRSAMGHSAARQLFAMLSADPAQAGGERITTFPTELVIRASCGTQARRV